jgi:ABC-type multidrug transport system fused ATPase/permease subunit
LNSNKSGNRELLRYLWTQLGPWRISVSAGILATLVSVGLDYVSPHLIGVLIDGLRTGWGSPQVLRVLSLMLLASLVGAFLLWAQR